MKKNEIEQLLLSAEGREQLAAMVSHLQNGQKSILLTSPSPNGQSENITDSPSFGQHLLLATKQEEENNDLDYVESRGSINRFLAFIPEESRKSPEEVFGDLKTQKQRAKSDQPSDASLPGNQVAVELAIHQILNSDRNKDEKEEMINIAIDYLKNQQ